MNHRKATFAAVIGTALEYYDVTLYGTLLFVLSPLFFPSENQVISSMIGMASFFVGFLMRPVGGIVFGHIGDLVGRKQAMALAILMVTIPTFTIGVLPTYAEIGLAAPIALLLCRILQNFCVGGEASGAITFVMEHANPARKGLASSMITVSVMSGSALGAGIAFLCVQPGMPEWGWRIPFLLGSLFGLIGYYVRYRIDETPEFAQARQQRRLTKVPILSVLKSSKIAVLCTMGITAGLMAPAQVIFIYMNDVFRNTLHREAWEILAINLSLMCLWLVLAIFAGILADRFGAKRIISMSLLGIVFIAYPAFWLFNETSSLQHVIAMQVVLSFFAAGVGGPFAVLMSSLFPTQKRNSGIGLGWTVGGVIFAGMVPYTSLTLVHWLNNPNAPAFVLMGSCLISWIAVQYTERTKSSSSPAINLTLNKATNFANSNRLTIF